MNVLIVHQFFLDENDVGGSRMNELSKVVAGRGHNVSVIAGGVHYATGKPYPYLDGKKWVRRNIADNVDLTRVRVSSQYNKSFFGRLKAYTEFAYRASTRVLKEKKIDVAITTSPPLFVGSPGKVASLFKKAKWVFEVRDLWPEFAITTGVLNSKSIIKWAYKYEKSVYRRCDKLVLLTPAFEKDVKSRYDFLNGKTEVITNAADFGYIWPDEEMRLAKRKELGLQDKVVFMYTGAHGLANGLEQVVETATRLRNNTSIHFALVGGGMMKEKLKSKVKTLDLKNIIFIDPVPKERINEYLNAADVCMSILMPNKSFEKVYPNKVFDYMACAKPVLNNIKGQTEELINIAGCGITVQPGNTDEFARAVQELASSNRLKELGSNGFQHVKHNFDRIVIMNRYADLLENLVRGATNESPR